MTWRLAKSLEVLRSQVNAYAPNRDKASDGTIGDEAHASSNSDHNPWVIDQNGQGVVTAIDFTHSPSTGLDCHQLKDALMASRDKRIKYVIWNKYIYGGAQGPQPWMPRPYTGSNPHTKHLHLSVRPEQTYYDDTTPWNRNPIS